MTSHRSFQRALITYFLISLVFGASTPATAEYTPMTSSSGAVRARPLDGATAPTRVMSVSPSLGIGTPSDNRADYAGQTIPAYKKLEVTFQLTGSVATDLFLPYTSSPPPGVARDTGITVDGEYSRDGFQTVFRIPAFPEQEFQYTVRNDPARGAHDWLYPTTNWSWKLRFAPPSAGNWQYRIVATDASGTTMSPPVDFAVTASSNPGFVRVSPTDSRYFEYEDGTYFPALGFNMNFSHISWADPILQNRPRFQALGANGVQLIRHWMSQWGIYSGTQTVWTIPEKGADAQPYVTVDPTNHPGFTPYPGSEVAAWLQTGSHHALMLGCWLKACPAVKPSTKYRVAIRYQIPVSLGGPSLAGQPYGLVAKLAPSWLDHPQNSGNGTAVTTYAASATAGWQTIEGTFTTTPNQYFLNPLYVALENTTTAGGTKVYIDRVDIEEDLGGGQYGANIVSRPWMAPHQYVDQALSRAFDLMLQEAEANGVTLKLVLLEKNDLILNHIGLDGATVPRGTGSNANFYGSWSTPSRVRWLQQAWWRYAQARWGYSTAIHSWELLNEGDPFNGHHAALAETFARYMHQFAPNRHLVTTSNWHSMPTPFWTSAPSLDYVDVHQYVKEGQTYQTRVDTNGMNSVATSLPADFDDTVAWTDRVSMTLGAKQPYGLNKPTMRGESGLVKGNDPNNPTQFLVQDTQGIWLHKWLWAQLNAGGLIDSGWWYETTNIYDPSRPSPNYLALFKRYYNFVKDLPISNGRYVDSGATLSSAQLRVRGQKDPGQGKAHLWIDNRSHTWKAAVDGTPVSPVDATVTLPGLPSGTYSLTWYDPYQGSSGLTQQAVTDSSGSLTFPLPSPLATDIAVRIERDAATSPPTPVPTTAPLPTPTSVPTTAPLPTPTNSPAGPSCGSSRPPVQVTTQRLPNGTIMATIRAGAGNIMQVKVGSVRNATVSTSNGVRLTDGSSHVISPAASQVDLRVEPISPVGGVLVPLVIRDGCGDWTTFFGQGH